MTARAMRLRSGPHRAQPTEHERRGPARRDGCRTAVSRASGSSACSSIAAVLGTTYLGNAFQAANSVSNVLFELVAAGALSAVLVPTFVQLLDTGDDAEADRLASGLLGIALVGLGIVTVVGIVAAPLHRARADRGRRERRGRGRATRARDVSCCGGSCRRSCSTRAATIATAVLYARRRFAITAAAPIGEHRRDGRRARRVPRRRRSGPDARSSRPASRCSW